MRNPIPTTALALLAVCAMSARVQAITEAEKRERQAQRDAEAAQAASNERAANAAANTLTPEEAAAGWRLLFDGTKPVGIRSLRAGLDFLKSGWKIENGALVLHKAIRDSGKVTGDDLITTEQYGDFEFAFQWKLSVSGNSGILYLARGGMGGAKATGCEYQIIDDVHNPEGLKGGPAWRTGALNMILPPIAEKVLNEPEKWNRGVLVVRGAHVEHWLNGARVLSYDIGSRELQQKIMASKAKVPHGFAQTKFKTALLILDEGEEISFRGLKIRVLAPGMAQFTGAKTGGDANVISTEAPAVLNPFANPATKPPQ